VNYYLNLDWTYEFEERKDGSCTVSIKELPWFLVGASTRKESLELLHDAMEHEFKVCLQEGEEIPEP